MNLLKSREQSRPSQLQREAHCERGMKIETFIFYHLICATIETQKL